LAWRSLQSVVPTLSRSHRSLSNALLLVTELYPPAVGGTPVLFDNLYSRLPGWDVTVLTGGEKPHRAVDERGVRVVRRPGAQTHWGVLHPRGLRRHWQIARDIARLTRGRQAIVHCGRALPEGFAALVSRRVYGGPPYVCWTHGEELAYARTSRELTLLLSKVHRGAAGFIANSHNTRRMLEAIGVAEHRIQVIHPGVDPERFGPSAASSDLRRRLAPAGGLVLLSVGRLQRRKGHDAVLRALLRLGGSADAMRYVIVGDGDERPRLQQLAADLGIQQHVTFVGEVSDSELPSYYGAADLFVHPNRDDRGDIEGFGIVFLEAAAAGLPVIGGNSGGVPEALEDGVTGFLVDERDPWELVRKIRLLAESEDLRRRLGDAGRARVVREFTWDRAAARLMAVHNALDLVA
jgi:phosphatidylinositol alpha-1,6-mannosyltransferase